MMTYSLTVLAQINRGNFKSLKITPTPDGMYGQFVDTTDGQVYSVEVKPMDCQLSMKAVALIKSGKEVNCKICGDALDSDEIVDNNGLCDYCTLQQEKPINKDESDDPTFVDDSKQLED